MKCQKNLDNHIENYEAHFDWYHLKRAFNEQTGNESASYHKDSGSASLVKNNDADGAGYRLAASLDKDGLTLTVLVCCNGVSHGIDLEGKANLILKNPKKDNIITSKIGADNIANINPEDLKAEVYTAILERMEKSH